MIGASMGHRLALASFGESHGTCVGALLSGCPAGLDIAESDIQPELDRRRPGQSAITTQRNEKDIVKILSGTYHGKTTGAPIAMIIYNADRHPTDYIGMIARPGHSDYTANVKYGGYNDPRGGGMFSGRLTATQVMAGTIARKLLHVALGIRITSYTASVGNVDADIDGIPTEDSIYGNDVRCPDPKAATIMRSEIVQARKSRDTLGGIVRSVASNVPAGLGEPIYNSLESDLAAAAFSIPAVKGVEFGSGFAGARSRGSINNDPFILQDGGIHTATNNAGGILGGISTGMDITMNVAFKPVPSIYIPQKSVDMKTMLETTLRVKGRYDPCIVPRAPPIVDSMMSLVLADHAMLRGIIGPVL